VAGARWQGTKTKLDSSSGSDDDPEAPGSPCRPAGNARADGIVVMAPKNSQARMDAQMQSGDANAASKSSSTEAAPAPEGKASAGDVAALDRIKWKKISARVLSDARGGKLSLKKLQKAALAKAALPVGVPRSAALKALMRRLQNSSQFCVTEKSVMLAKDQTQAGGSTAQRTLVGNSCSSM
jgi:hypothetical protein